MTLPVVYRKTTEGILANYDFIDAIEGLGYVNFYAVNHPSYSNLNRNRLPSQTPLIKFSCAGSGVYTLGSEKNWDLDFNIPQTIGGGPLFVSMSIEEEAIQASTAYARLDLIIHKVDAAANETVLASISGAAVTFGANVAGSHRMATKVTVPRTKIKAGEKLRVNTEVWTNGSAAWKFIIWCDGEARGTTYNHQVDTGSPTATLDYHNSTDIVTLVPFRLDL